MGCSSSNTVETPRRQLNAKFLVFKHEAPFSENYKLLQVIGQGGHGKVYRAMNKRTAQIRAVKIIKKTILNNRQKEYTSEIDILCKVDHPNIVKIFEYYEDKSFFYIVMEYLLGRNLLEDIRIRADSYSEIDVANIIRDILLALDYLHSYGIVHRDIKLENVMVEIQQNKREIKLIDLGISRFSDQGIDSIQGSLHYMAPEVLQEDSVCDFLCDIWSLGVVLYIMLFGRFPFEARAEESVEMAILKGDYSLSMSSSSPIAKEGIDLVKKMLVKNPRRRIQAKKALKHSFFSLVKSESKVSKGVQTQVLSNLANFTKRNLFQKACISYITFHLDVDRQKQILIDCFKELDLTGAGLDRDNLKSAFQRIRDCKMFEMSENELDFIFKEVDVNGNGTIELEEFLSASIQMEETLTERNMRNAFEFLDKDSNGELDPEELKQFISLLPNNYKEYDIQKNLQNILAETDLNKDGKVCFKEFKTSMRKCLRNQHK